MNQHLQLGGEPFAIGDLCARVEYATTFPEEPWYSCFEAVFGPRNYIGKPVRVRCFLDHRKLYLRRIRVRELVEAAECCMEDCCCVVAPLDRCVMDIFLPEHEREKQHHLPTPPAARTAPPERNVEVRAHVAEHEPGPYSS